MTLGLLFVAIFTLTFSMVAKRLASSVFTAPMLFIAFGFFMSWTKLLDIPHMEEALHFLAEVTLIVLLFLDAAQTDVMALRKRFVWPFRMLFLGLPLAIAIGTLFAWALLPSWSLVAAALVAAILAPTDAALGQAVVTNPLVPERARRALTVESGLNDGLALPAILLFASLTANIMEGGETNWLLFGTKQLILGPLAGILIGVMGGKILLWAKKHDLTADVYEGVGAIALAVAAYLFATTIGGNGFIAAFVGGLLFGNIVQGKCKFIYEFTESEGQGLTWGAFFLLGLILVPEAVLHLDLAVLGIILSSLFIVRPLAIWISLIGTDASNKTRLFFGWFGPRGLATALFALIVVEKINPEIGEYILNLAVNAVWISTLLHGVTAMAGARWYGMQMRGGETLETTKNEN